MKQYTTVYLMRHGQTTSNRLGAIMGQQDMPLSEHGIWQAGQAALALSRSDVSLAALYSSPLQRALHTSLIIAQAID